MQMNNTILHVIAKPYLIMTLVIIMILFTPVSLLAMPSDPASPNIYTPFILSSGFLNFLLTSLAALIIICAIIIIFSFKLRKVNRELLLRNNQIEEINQNLLGTNHELSLQKDFVTREYLETDKFFKMLIQSADDGIAFFDKEWNLKFANPAFYSVIGYDEGSYSSFDTSLYIHPDYKNFPAERLEALKNKGFHENELRLRHKDGHYVTLSSRSVTVKDESGKTIGALTISRDITSMKDVNEELIKSKIEAETSNRLKTSFLANISHEIRTPLNSVVGFSNLLLSNDLTQKLREEYVEHINYNSEKLLQIIGDIIDLSRLESSQIEITYEETSVRAVVNEVISEARQIIKRNEKAVILNVKDLFGDNADLIFTDKVWLKRVLNHLMDNAIKFTLDGSIELSFLKENDNLVFKISDTGVGIKTENLNRIFEEFRQEIDGHHRPFEGLGIGLTLAKEVVERMGGRISVRSEKGMGSEFSFSIPYKPAGGTRGKLKEIMKEEILSVKNWSSRKCLLVDDNKDVLIYLRRILLDTGIEVLLTRSGPEAIEIIRTTPGIDVVLLDMQMPEMNGIETTKHIRKIKKDLPIIAQTAFVFEDDKDIILEAGCDACLIKPIRKEHLLTVMSSFLKSE